MLSCIFNVYSGKKFKCDTFFKEFCSEYFVNILFSVWFQMFKGPEGRISERLIQEIWHQSVEISLSGEIKKHKWNAFTVLSRA